MRPSFFSKHFNAFQQQFLSAFDTFNVSNSFVKNTRKVNENPLLIAAKTAQKPLNFVFQTKLRFFNGFGMMSVEPKSHFGIENTSDGFERVLQAIKDDYLHYYKDQIDSQTRMNCYLRSKFSSFVLKLSDDRLLFEQFLRTKKLSELFYVILVRALPELSAKHQLVNSKEKESSKNRIDFQKFCLEEISKMAEETQLYNQTVNSKEPEPELRRRATTINKRFGDTSYKYGNKSHTGNRQKRK